MAAWVVSYRDWVGGSRYGKLFTGARKNGRGPVLKAHQLPPHVAEFLEIRPIRPENPKGFWTFVDFDPDTFDSFLFTRMRRARYSATSRFRTEVPDPDRRREDPPLRAVSPVSVGRQFPDYEGPGCLYRATYKYTDCGPSVGLLLSTGTLYCDDLYGLGTWTEMAAKGIKVLALTVSSIVEGTDAEISPIEVPASPLKTLHDRFGRAVAEVNSEASWIWNQTHGCPKCGIAGEYGGHAINPACRSCKGQGVIL